MWTFRAIKLLILCVFTLYWGISHAGITGIKDSSHDLTQSNIGAQFKYRTKQLCVFCHTPHGANSSASKDTYFDTSGGPIGYVGTGGALLLWNRALSNALDYKLYDSSSAVTVTKVRIYSLLCLSCHDGVGALNVVQNFPGDGTDDGFGGIAFAGGGQKPDQIGDVFDGQINIGGRTPLNARDYVELRDDHPISVDYATARAQDASSLEPVSGSGDNLWVGDPKIRLFGGYVECTSCHDVHNEGDQSTGVKYPFLWLDNAGSNLCINCHKK